MRTAPLSRAANLAGRARLTSTPVGSGDARRPPNASSTFSAAVRPNRTSHAFGIASEFTMVPVASLSSIRAPEAFESVNVSVSDLASVCADRP